MYNMNIVNNYIYAVYCMMYIGVAGELTLTDLTAADVPVQKKGILYYCFI